eukprot:SAG31_NODE_37232_length_306_cov_0.729469_1_plen_41_part_01
MATALQLPRVGEANEMGFGGQFRAPPESGRQKSKKKTSVAT